MINVNIHYIPIMKKYGPATLADRPAVQQITGEIFPYDNFWKYKSSYIRPEDMDEFTNKAFEKGWSVTTIGDTHVDLEEND